MKFKEWWKKSNEDYERVFEFGYSLAENLNPFVLRDALLQLLGWTVVIKIIIKGVKKIKRRK